MKTLKGNMLYIGEGVLCHQCNCLGVMGSGIAKQIKQRWPHVYNDYRTAYMNGKLSLGEVILSKAEEGLYIAHLCGQYAYGRENKQYTDYKALDKCFVFLNELQLQLQLYVPCGIGCGLANGSWDIVSNIIENRCPTAIVVEYT